MLDAPPQPPGICTLAQPKRHVTINAFVPEPDYFCSIVGEVLQEDVLHAIVNVSHTKWHYRGSRVSCRLRFLDGPYRVTIRNSSSVCRWFTRAEWTGWHTL
jgi:hypothetical protein